MDGGKPGISEVMALRGLPGMDIVMERLIKRQKKK